jgi:hypothetical protein
MSAVTTFSRTAANNNSAAPNGAPEGWAPSAVNDTIRELMTAIVNEATNNGCKVLASVSGTDTITASATPDITAYAAGTFFVFTPAANNTGAATLNIDSLGALDIQKYDGEALAAGDLRSGIPAFIVLDSGADDWLLLNPQSQITATPNTSAEEFGFKGLPVTDLGSSATLTLTYAARCVRYTGGSGQTITIPANASVAYPIGTVIAFVNNGSASVDIAITSDTMRLAGTSSTGTRTLAQYGMAAAHYVASATWFISGTGLS